MYDRVGTTVVPYVAIGSNRRTIGGDHIAMYRRVGSGVTNPNALAMLSIPTTA